MFFTLLTKNTNSSSVYAFCILFAIFASHYLQSLPKIGGDRFWQQVEFDGKHAENCVGSRKSEHSNYKWQ